MLSQTANHALRALLYMAQAEVGAVVTAKAMAEATGAPPRYLAKTLQELAGAGLVRGTRGREGGYVLAVPAASITVGDVVRAFDGPETPARCLLGNRACSPHTPCAAHVRWLAAQESAQASVSGIRIVDLLSGAAVLDEDEAALDAAS